MKKVLLLFVLVAFLSQANSQVGALDPSFAGKGWAYTSFLKGNFNEDAGKQVLLQKDGRLIVVIHLDNLVTIARYQSNGNLDERFGISGFSEPIHISDAKAALQSDGKIVVAGKAFNSTIDFKLVRYNADGTLDLSFGDDGIVITDFGFSETVTSIAIQDNGKIVLAGYAFEPSTSKNKFALARYNTNGSLDHSFGGDGKVITSISDTYDVINDIAIQEDQKIVVAGRSDRDFAIARYHTNGTLDKAFDEDGIVVTDFGNSGTSASSIAIQNNGKIVAAGNVIHPLTFEQDFAIARYNNDGSWDASFDGDGKLTSNLGGSETNTDLLIQSDGKLVLTGYLVKTGSTTYQSVLLRYNSSGSLDMSFDADGKVDINIDDYTLAFSVVLQGNNTLTVAGYVEKSIGSSSALDFFLARYSNTGSLDESFDKDGILLGYYPNGRSFINAIAVQKDGKVVVAGHGNDKFALARYHADGTLDRTFDEDGIVITNFIGSEESARAIAIQNDGKIVVAGYEFNTEMDFAIARYNPDGSLDETFDGDGKVITNFFGDHNSANAITIQKDGKIVVAGRAYNPFNNNNDFAVARYHSNGKPDLSFDGDGKLTTDLGGDNSINDVVIQDDGKIIVVGHTQKTETNDYDFAIARYHSNGSLDISFGEDGIVWTDFTSSDIAHSVVLQNDGKILVAGGANNFDTDNSDFALARYNTDGSLDHTFSEDGKLATDFGVSETASSIILHNNKIVLTGRAYDEDYIKADLALARYLEDGTLDATFDGDGKVTTDLGFLEFSNAATIFNDRLYLAGELSGGITRGFVAAYQLGGSKEICGNKIDDNGDGQIDEGCPGLPFLTIDDITVSESQRRAEVTVRLSKITDKKVFVDYFTRGGSARIKAFKQEGKDYEPNSGTLSISAGKQSVSFVVKITNDDMKEKDEYFKVQLQNAVHATIRKAQGMVTIVDDDHVMQVAPEISSINAMDHPVPEELLTKLRVTAHPNPSSTYFILSVQGISNNTALIRVTDAAGRLVETRAGIAANTTLHLGHHYRPGIYYAEIIQGKEKIVVKLVKLTP